MNGICKWLRSDFSVFPGAIALQLCRKSFVAQSMLIKFLALLSPQKKKCSRSQKIWPCSHISHWSHFIFPNWIRLRKQQPTVSYVLNRQDAFFQAKLVLVRQYFNYIHQVLLNPSSFLLHKIACCIPSLYLTSANFIELFYVNSQPAGID